MLQRIITCAARWCLTCKCASMSADTCQSVKKASKKRPSKKRRQKLRDKPNSQVVVNHACQANKNFQTGVTGAIGMHESDDDCANHVVQGILTNIRASFAEYDKQQWHKSPEGQKVLNEFLDNIQFEHKTVVYERWTAFATEWQHTNTC